jgi:hypothetical protein
MHWTAGSSLPLSGVALHRTSELSCLQQTTALHSRHNLQPNWQNQLLEIEALLSSHPSPVHILDVHNPDVPNAASAALLNGTLDAGGLEDTCCPSPPRGSNSTVGSEVSLQVELTLRIVVDAHVETGHSITVSISLPEHDDQTAREYHEGAAEGGVQGASEGGVQEWQLSSTAPVAPAPPSHTDPVEEATSASAADGRLLRSVKYPFPIALTVHAAAEYSSILAPSIEVEEKWLTALQLKDVARHLKCLWDEVRAGNPVLLTWTEWLRVDMVTFLGLQEGLVVSGGAGAASVSATCVGNRYSVVRSRSALPPLLRTVQCCPPNCKLLSWNKGKTQACPNE